MEEQTPATTRLYVGGLGESVTDDDLRNTFAKLGSLQSVEIIRTKGRSFAYINFLPSCDKSLAKLFSTYNGCSWKGGKLKLEKAKEHYIDQLRKEWAEDAELKISKHVNPGDVDANTVASPEPKSSLDLENMQFKLFFPKLRKLKSLPLRGTGKHKYSFQRIQVPAFPIHFCDCPEHSAPAHAPKVAGVHSNPVRTPEVKAVDDSYTLNAGVNEEEFKMMNSVINRLLGQESTVTDSGIQDGGVTQEEIKVMNSVLGKVLDKENSLATEQQDLHTSPEQTVSTSEDEEENYLDDGTDDDDIKINAVTGRNHGSFSSSSWGRQRKLTNQMARSDERQNLGNLARQKGPGFLIRNLNSFNKRRKSLSIETNEDELSMPVHELKTNMQTQSKESEEAPMKRPTEPDTQRSIGGSSVSEKATQCTSSKRKSSWTQLIGGGNSSFNISQILS